MMMMMKICALFAAVVVSVQATFAEATSEAATENKRRYVSTYPSKVFRELRRKNQEYRRKLAEGEISEECATALYDLEEDATLDAAEDAKEDEFENMDPAEYCDVAFESIVSISCAYDFKQLDGHADYVAACEASAVDSRTIDFSFEMDCSDSEMSLSVDFLDDTCLPTACSDAEYSIILEAIEMIIAETFAEELEGTDATCTVDASSSVQG